MKANMSQRRQNDSNWGMWITSRSLSLQEWVWCHRTRQRKEEMAEKDGEERERRWSTESEDTANWRPAPVRWTSLPVVLTDSAPLQMRNANPMLFGHWDTEMDSVLISWNNSTLLYTYFIQSTSLPAQLWVVIGIWHSQTCCFTSGGVERTLLHVHEHEQVVHKWVKWH